ncbi:unnamed protein product [Rhodiola kirilowii]
MPAQKKSACKITRKDMGVHHVVFQKGGLPDGTVLGYCVQKKIFLEGYKKGNGIVCGCCDSEVSASNFEVHAGFARHRKPYHHIFTSNGVSLHEFAVYLLQEPTVLKEKSDLLCTKCSKGGKLMCCDMCPRAFHLGCLSHSSIPRGLWSCDICTASAIASGRVPRVYLMQQITERHIRIFEMVEDGVACALCSACDYSKSGFDPRTIIICDQCQKGYHVSCLKKHIIADLKGEPEGKWFCSKACQSNNAFLHKLLDCGEIKLPESMLVPFKKKQEKKGLDSSHDRIVKLRLLKGELASSETAPLLSKSVDIFHDCFDPIKDESGEDRIPLMVYGKDNESVEGIYCAVLMSNSVVVSTVTFRVYGDIAELPLVATPKEYQGQGYFQVLFSCIEKLLACLKVEKMVLPSAETSISIWTKKFGFKEIEEQEFERLKKKHYHLITFEETTMLERGVPGLKELDSNPFNSLKLT